MTPPRDIVYRLAYRVGQLQGRGWPFSWFVRHDIALLREAIAEIDRLRVTGIPMEVLRPDIFGPTSASAA